MNQARWTTAVAIAILMASLLVAWQLCGSPAPTGIIPPAFAATDRGPDAVSVSPPPAAESTPDRRWIEPTPEESPRDGVRPRARVEVFFSDGTTLANTEVRFVAQRSDDWLLPARLGPDQGALVGRTGADGVLLFALPSEHGHLAIADPGLVLLFTSRCGGPRAPDHALRLVVARAVTVTGMVVDSDRQPLAGVQVATTLLRPVDFPLPLEHSTPTKVERCETDQFGVLPQLVVPARHARLDFALDGYEPQSRDVGSQHEHIDIVLQPIDRDRRLLVGAVTDMRGLPVAGAEVGISDGPSTTADTDGRYRLDLSASSVASGDMLFAARAGLQPAVIEDAGERIATKGTSRIDLQLGPATQLLVGRIVEADGTPVGAGIVVYPWDQPSIGWNVTREELAVDASVEPLQLGGPKLRAFGRTDPEGRFSIPGMNPDRDYVLRVYDDRAHFGWNSPPVRVATGGVEIRLPANRQRSRLSGRVVDARGMGVAGVDVGISVEVFRAGGSVNSTGAQLTTTDAAGRFEVGAVPRVGLQLSIGGDDIVGRAIDVSPEQPDDGLIVEVARRCFVRIVSDENRGIVSFAVLDAAGKELHLAERRSGGSTSSNRQRLHGGVSVVLAVGDTGRTAVFFAADGKEIARTPLRLIPGEVTEIRP